MASRQAVVDYLVEQMGAAGAVSARKMFGEYGIYHDGRMVALVCGDTLFVKPTEAGRRHLDPVTDAPPYPGAKPHLVVPEEAWDDADRLAELVRLTAAALPPPAPERKPKR